MVISKQQISKFCATRLMRGDIHHHSFVEILQNITELQQILKYP